MAPQNAEGAPPTDAPNNRSSNTTVSVSRTQFCKQLRDTALDYSRRGWPVLPLLPGSKIPLTRHGLHDASTDPQRICIWWSRCPDANIGIRTGVAFDVLDVDLHGTNGFAALSKVDEAGLLNGYGRIVATTSGGRHLYYLPSGAGNSTTRVGLDFRGAGGYVVAPPSRINGRPYTVVSDDDPTGALDWAAVRNLVDPRPVHVPQQRRGDEAENIDRLVRHVARQQEGNRNAGLFWAACRAVEQGHSDMRAFIEAGVQAGLDATEAARTCRSAIRTIRGGAA
jgi:hypothetical protein